MGGGVGQLIQSDSLEGTPVRALTAEMRSSVLTGRPRPRSRCGALPAFWHAVSMSLTMGLCAPLFIAHWVARHGNCIAGMRPAHTQT